MTPGIVKMIVLAVVLGFAFNAMNAHGLPVIRRPLRETRRFAARSTLVKPAPKKLSEVKTQLSNESKQKISIAPQKQAAAPNAQQKIQAHKNVVPKTKAIHEQPKKTAQALFTTLAGAKALINLLFLLTPDP